MNSPYFSGYDWSGITTENIERIEIARGPFSALYGSDAIGGVVQVFTRPGAEGVSGRATGEAGNQGQGQGSAYVSVGAGARLAAASYRYIAFDGNGRIRTGGSATARRAFCAARRGGRIGVEWGLSTAKSAIPGPDRGLRVSLDGARHTHEGRLSVPANFALSEDNQLDVLLGGVQSEPAYRDTAGGFESQTDARRPGSVSDTARLGKHTLTAFGSWERWKVDDASNFGLNLDDVRTTLWGLGRPGLVTFGAFTITAGLRYDHYTTYGDAWSPRGTISWLSPDKLWKVRASGGTGFRAPSIGELYYPFRGNPDLKPEKSVSAEVGGERYFGSGRAEVSVFWNDLKDLIVYDFATSLNFNVGHARTYGVELGWQQTLMPELGGRRDVHVLEDRGPRDGRSAPAPSRERRRRSVLRWMPIPAINLSPRLLYVGSRADSDPGTGDPVTDPSYLRVDLVARWQATTTRALLRIINLDEQRVRGRRRDIRRPGGSWPAVWT